MDASQTPQRAERHDGWTPERRTRFLDSLAARGNVRLACREAGMSPEAAYRLKRREPLFARAWAAALVLAHDAGVEVLADRAIDGVEEPVYYRGELVGTRRKYDARLLLAHVARLDKAAEDAAAQADAGRFDELLACIAGEEPPPDFAHIYDPLPIDRESACALVADAAVEEADLADDCEPQERNAAYECGYEEGRARWDAWHGRACRRVDRLCGRLGEGASGPSGELPAEPAARPCERPLAIVPWTPSESSTSPGDGEGAGMA